LAHKTKPRGANSKNKTEKDFRSNGVKESVGGQKFPFVEVKAWAKGETQGLRRDRSGWGTPILKKKSWEKMGELSVEVWGVVDGDNTMAARRPGLSKHANRHALCVVLGRVAKKKKNRK